MTQWIPILDAHAGPRYRAIADAIAEDIASGALVPGARLPTHRELAWRLGVTVGTVTRAYKDAAARGLIDGEIGRGSFVRERRPSGWGAVTDTTNNPIDFGLNFPPAMDQSEAALRATLAQIATDDHGPSLAAYDPAGGREAHRASLARWLTANGVATRADDVVITAGAQNAITVALMALTEPGDAVLCEALTHPGFKTIAARLRVRTVPVEIDRDGVVPDAVESAIRLNRPKAIFLIPTLHNPTTATLSAERRGAIAEMVARHGVPLIEDDIYRAFAGDDAAPVPPPIASLAPEHTLYLASTSKHLAPGLRVGALRVPKPLRARLVAALRDTLWMAPPLMVEILVRWLADGTADRLTQGKRREQAARTALARAHLGDWLTPAPTSAPHHWLTLPQPWTGAEAADALRRDGITVADGTVFAAASGAGRNHVRLALGRPEEREAVARGLRTIAETLAENPNLAPSLDREVV
ncbi:MAG: PLP-dependent aminotransferase family protein [Alphaproteobacteria bacterium]|nr:PLP-dependent aminotransferase family protein [Alphaproteobacteria bacterium]